MVVLNSLYYEENTCYRQSICLQTDLRFQLRLRETFSNSIFLRFTKQNGKSVVVQISAVFDPLTC